jgi:predicted alpha/beta-fold hydrolase
MHYFRGSLILPFLLLFPFSALADDSNVAAGWSPKAFSDYEKLEEKTAGRTNGELAGVWGGIGVDLAGILRSFRFRRNEYRNEVDYAPDGAPITYLVSRTSRKVSPLAVYFSGIFGDATGSGALQVGRQLRRARNHVVMLPNPWGNDFQAAHPNFMPGDFDREARAMADLLKDAIHFIGPDRISDIHFYGESYGGFLGPATAAYLNREGKYHVKSVTSVSVPYQIGNAVDALDQMADQSETAYFDHGCESAMHNFFRLIGFAFELLEDPHHSDVYSKEGTGCSQSVFAYMAFEQPLVNLGKNLNARKPSAVWATKNEAFWNRKLRFRDIGNLFFGVSSESVVGRDSANLAYWIDQLRGQGTKTLALIAKDDPLNPAPGIGSYKVMAAYTPAEVLILSKGSHLGFRGNRFYTKLIRDQFRAGDVDQTVNLDTEAADTSAPDDSLDNDPAPPVDGLDASLDASEVDDD